MTEEKFSATMCVYGGDNAVWFDEALGSVYKQSKIPDEVVLLVDGPVSTDIDKVIQYYSERFGLKVFQLEKNMGHGIARKEALSHCTNDIIAIADADDINTLDRFELQFAEFEKNPSLSAVSSYCYHFTGSKDNILNEETLPAADKEIKRFLKTRSPLCHAATMLRKSAVDAAGGYLDWYYCEDYYLWVRMYLNGAVFANVPKSLLYVRTDERQVARRGGYKYFHSMKKLFDFMHKNHIIGLPTYLFNVLSRFCLQVLFPTRLRAWLRKMHL